MTNLSKSDIQKLIKNRDPSLSYAKPKKASGEHWCNYCRKQSHKHNILVKHFIRIFFAFRKKMMMYLETKNHIANR